MYQHLFFDLDKTLWDFETNSNETLREIFTKHEFLNASVSLEKFIDDYILINEKMWDDYRKGLIDKETLRYGRFDTALSKQGVDDKELSYFIANDYIALAPFKTNLIPDTIEVLDYLSDKYSLHIITNGFEEVQHVKMKNCGIDKYFANVITSETAGYKKPDTRIFDYSLKLANAEYSNSIMIGDSLEADIIGARESNIHQVYFNPKGEKHKEEVTFEIKDLKELIGIL